MDLIGSLTDNNSVRGIILNYQIIDLFNIIEHSQSIEDSKKQVYEYLDGLPQSYKFSREMNSKGLSLAQKVELIVNEKLNIVSNKKEFIKLILDNAMQIRANCYSNVKYI